MDAKLFSKLISHFNAANLSSLDKKLISQTLTNKVSFHKRGRKMSSNSFQFLIFTVKLQIIVFGGGCW